MIPRHLHSVYIDDEDGQDRTGVGQKAAGHHSVFIRQSDDGGRPVLNAAST